MINRRAFLLLSQIGIAYPNSTLTLKSQLGKVKAGDRMPYFTFSDGSSVYDYLNEPAFKILSFGNQTNNIEEHLQNLEFDVMTKSFREVPKAIFGNAVNFYILLRPDNHISYIGNNPESCGELLAGIGIYP